MDKAADLIEYVEHAGIARLTLSRPHHSNAFDLPTARLLNELVGRCAADRVRVVLVHGAGKRFCAGGDIAAMAADGLNPESIAELARTLDAALRKLSSLDKPVVAAVHGAVAGAGLGLLLSCDVAVAARSTKFLMAYDGVGLTPDCGVSYLLPRAVGLARALSLALTRRVLSASEAEAWGLVGHVAEDDRYLQVATELAGELAERPSFALGQAKRLLRTSWSTDRASSGEDEARTIGRAAATDTAARLVAEFLGGA